MTLIDSSAWIEFLRKGPAPARGALRELLAGEEVVEVTDPIVMEVLSGARDEQHTAQLTALLRRARLIPVTSEDFVEAALLYRACRGRGSPVRRLTDCLIAAVAIREDVPVLHNDRDFDVLARHTPLRLAPA